MSNRAERNGKTLSFLIVWTLAMGGLFAAVIAISPASHAGTCDQVGGVITGDWTITTPQVCSGILYSVDGNININAGGSLTLVNGGLSFSKDTSHAGYVLNVNAGGALILDNSVVTTQTNAISPFLKLVMTVSGAGSSLTMKNGATLRFPGWFNATNAAVNLTDSKITGFSDSDLSGLGLDTDDNNDGPIIAWTTTTATLYRSSIDRIYEYTGGTPGNIALASGSNLWAFDSYIGVDYASNALTPGSHNELRVDGTSNAYLYNVTIDRTQDPADKSSWQPAFRPTAAGGSISLFRWLHASVQDSNGFPVNGATIWSALSPSSTTAQYPDNGLSSIPSSTALWYLGRTASGANAWNRTDANGAATIPLFTDQVTTASLPNAESFGNYHETAAYAASSNAGDVAFAPYPSVSVAENNAWLTIAFTNLQVCPTGVTTWATDRTIVGTVSVGSCVEISRSVTIASGGLYVDQGSDGRNSAYVKILSGGRLTLVGSTVWSNYPLAVYVADGGTLVASQGSTFSLAARGSPGLLREDGPTSDVTIQDSVIDANVVLNGRSANLMHVTFLGAGLTMNTVQKSNLWDATLTGVTNLNLLTDDGNVNTVDVDIRNTTFDSIQTSQLVFGGNQNVHLTSVRTYDPNNAWWVGMITGNARVSRYSWLTVRAVDGAGARITGANVGITVRRLDPISLVNVTVPNPVAGDIYLAGNATWPISAPEGVILYRAFAESRTVSTRVVNNSYSATAYAVIRGTTYSPDAIGSTLLTADTLMDLRFSSVSVLTPPDLQLRQADYPGTRNVTQNAPFFISVLIYNNGQTAGTNVSLAAYLNGNRANQLARVNGLTVGTFLNQPLNISGVALAGPQTIELVVDPDNRINEGSPANEANNFANVSVNVQPPKGFIAIASPASGVSVEPGKSIFVTGYVRDQSSNPIGSVPLTITLESGGVIASNSSISQADGFFSGTITVPASTQDGTYNLFVRPSSAVIDNSTQPLVVKKIVPFLSQPVPILGLPFWLFFIILAAVAAIAIGVTLYWKVYGLGKMVECGECGAFIPEDSTTCPKCGVEFEKDMAKCSNCQAWIPVDVKQCPECGVEFATGEVEMADYQEKMRLQYDEVVTKFKEEAGRQLGRTLSDREFQEWWRKQPTFLTFEDWLREEEEMRKMGSKPCPSCGTLNSVTATVCHKCGSLMREAPRPPGGGGTVAAPPRKSSVPTPSSSDGTSGSQASPYAPPGAGGAAGTEGIPRRVIRKPVASQPVVQKKVIKKPMDGSEGGDGTEGQSGDSTEDEL